jgi:hypothetical protein
MVFSLQTPEPFDMRAADSRRQLDRFPMIHEFRCDSTKEVLICGIFSAFSLFICSE